MNRKSKFKIDFLKYPLLVITCLMTITKATGQSFHSETNCIYSLKGTILDVDTKEPLPYVSIKIKGVEKSTLTDLNGVFSFSHLCDSTNMVVISCFGYCDTVCKSFHNKTKSPNIYLKQEVITLADVTIKIDQRNEETNISIAESTIDEETIQSNPTKTLAGLLTEIDGVTMTSTGTNIQLPIIHGLYGNRVLILNNSLKHGFQNWGTDHAPEIDISSAKRLRVVKGASGVRYGPEALGGAIIIESDPMYLNEPFKTRIATGFETNGRGYFINSEIGKGHKHWGYHIGANYIKIGDRKAPGYMLTNTGKEEKAINGGIRFSKGEIDLNLYYSYIDQNLGILRSSIAESGTSLTEAIESDKPRYIGPFSYRIKEPNHLTNHHLLKSELEWFYSDEGSLKLKVGTQLNKREEYDVRRDNDLPIIDLDLTTNDYQLDWYHPTWKNLDGIIGLQAFTQNNDNNPGTGTTPFIPNYNTTRYSTFIIEQVQKKRISFEIGARIDYEHNNVRGRETNQDIFRDDYSFFSVTTSGGIIKELTENTTIRSNLGTAWRTPNMAELYSFGQHGFKLSYGLLRYYSKDDNRLSTDRVVKMTESNVSPEKGIKWINEYKSKKNKNTYTITAYLHFIQNYIFDRPIAVVGTIRGAMPAFIFDQKDALFIGGDITWKKTWSKKINGTFGISYLWSQNIEDNAPLINQPPISTYYKASWETKTILGLKDSKIYLKPSYTFKQHQAPRTVTPLELIDGTIAITPESEIFDFQNATPGYFLLDIGWIFSWKKIGGSITARNVLNTSYRNYLNEMRYFADEMGVNLLINFNYMFNTKTKQK